MLNLLKGVIIVYDAKRINKESCDSIKDFMER